MNRDLEIDIEYIPMMQWGKYRNNVIEIVGCTLPLQRCIYYDCKATANIHVMYVLLLPNFKERLQLMGINAVGASSGRDRIK